MRIDPKGQLISWAGIILAVVSVLTGCATHQADHTRHHSIVPEANVQCREVAIRCAKTVTAAVGRSGRLWFVWTLGETLYVNYSDDLGQGYSPPIAVNSIPEKIAARGENRPKIGLDDNDNIYLSWVQLGQGKWTADIRFAFSLSQDRRNQGKNFSTPVTVNDDGLITSHSFNEMVVTANGQVFISWLDGRDAAIAKKLGKTVKGSAIYLASASPVSGKIDFPNRAIAQSGCVCCRLAMGVNVHELPIMMWRHIYGDNYRDHALATLNVGDNAININRISFENWQINGCPHHGPSLVMQDQRLHMVWFNNAPDKSGLFYRYSDDGGTILSKTIHLANIAENPSHPNLSLGRDGKIKIVWQTFDGQKSSVKLISSASGVNWSQDQVIASYQGTTDYPFLIQHPEGQLLLWHKLGQALQLVRVN